jgi:adenylosuccinate synthase
MIEEVIKGVTEEGLSEIQVRQLLSEMEMLDENRDDIWGEEEDNQEMEFLPADILPSAQDFAEDMQMETRNGFDIPDMMVIQDSLGLVEVGKGKTMEVQEQQGKEKIGSTKHKWGPMLAERRSTRIKMMGELLWRRLKIRKRRRIGRISTRKVKQKNLVVGVNIGKDAESIENNLDMCVKFEVTRERPRVNNPEGVGKIVGGSNSTIEDGECGKVRMQTQ